MSRFTSHLGLTLYENANGRPVLRDGRSQWYLWSPLLYEVGAEGSGEIITVPAFNPEGKSDEEIVALFLTGLAFVTDLASIPWLVRGIYPPDGPWAKAAVIHDYLYKTKGLGGRYARAEADAIFYEAMGVLGVPEWRRRVIYTAVRVGGAKGWGS